MSADVDTIRENVADIARGCRSGRSHNPAVYEAAIGAALDRLAAAEAQRDALAEALERVLSWSLPEGTIETWALPEWLAREVRAALAAVTPTATKP